METHRKFREPKLLLATMNEAKIRELSHLLTPFGIEPVPASALGIPEPDETGATFQENSLNKAIFYSKQSDMPVLADDSGLCIAALDGAPGIFSARWAGPESDYGKACDRIQRELEGKEDRSAHFECALTLAWPDGHTEGFTGTVKGTIVDSAVGTNGFAYDPIFIPEGHNKTFAQMGDNEKCIISHRAMALEFLIKNCLTE
jgi:XTP/dITP diphosphohydrolase